jgi:hypothetical protein
MMASLLVYVLVLNSTMERHICRNFMVKILLQEGLHRDKARIHNELSQLLLDLGISSEARE